MAMACKVGDVAVVRVAVATGVVVALVVGTDMVVVKAVVIVGCWQQAANVAVVRVVTCCCWAV